MTIYQVDTQIGVLLALGFLLSSFGILSSVRFAPAIMSYAAGSAVLSGYAACLAFQTGYAHLWIVAVLTILVKAVAIPWILIRLVRHLRAQTEGKPEVGVPVSLLIGGILTIIAYAADRRFLPGLTAPYDSGLGAGLAVMLIGMTLIALRRQAVTQLIGLLLCENGTLMIGLAIAPNLPLVVEFGILMDVIVAVIIFSRLVLYMHEVIQTTDTLHLRRLRG